MAPTAQSLLDVENLRVTFYTPTGPVKAVRDISFTLGREKLGVVGESGSGKSQTGRAILGLVEKNGRVEATKLKFRDIDLLNADDKTMRAVRGNRVSMILQDPKHCLNPVMTAGAQIVEAFEVNHRSNRALARDQAMTLLEAVDVREPARVFDAYPHELSGGMAQRIMIAMMMIPEPDIVIADEPTSALDASVRLRVLSILDDLVMQRNTALIFISHDLSLVATFCTRILVMYAGQIVESLPADCLHHAQHPYTRALINCRPSIGRRRFELPELVRNPAWHRDLRDG